MAGDLLQRGPEGSTIAHVETPDVDVMPSEWTRDNRGLTINLTMRTEAEFDDYAIALWGLPDVFSPDRHTIETNANDFISAKNTDGECHLILMFDLKPDTEIQVTLCAP